MPEQHNISERPESNHRDSLRNALVATAVAGALLPGVIQHTETTPVESTSTEYVTDYVVQQLPQEPTELEIKLPGTVENKYQRDFETDFEDRATSLDQVGTILDEQLTQKDWQDVTKVEIIGMASAEDDAPDEGLSQPSTINLELAKQRAQLAHDATTEVFSQHGINSEAITEVSAREDSWSEEEFEHGQKLADQFGYSNVANMVEKYNLDTKTVPPAIVDFLKPLLDARRGAVIRLTLPKRGEEAKVVIIPIQRIEQKTEQKNITTQNREVVSNRTVGFIPDVEKVKTEVHSMKSRGSQDRDLYQAQIPHRQIRGQKPVRHRGRTHMTGPRW